MRAQLIARPARREHRRQQLQPVADIIGPAAAAQQHTIALARFDDGVGIACGQARILRAGDVFRWKGHLQHRGIRTGTLHAMQHAAVDKSAFIFAHRDLPPLKQDADAPIRHQIKGYRAAAMISRRPPARRDGQRADLQFCARLLHANPTFHNIGSIEAGQTSFVVFSTKNTTTLDGIWSMTFANFQKQKNIIFFYDNFVCSVRKD